MNFYDWQRWFEYNRSSMDKIPTDGSPELSMDEKALITRSIQQFQHGEYSEGKNLIRFAKEWGREDYLGAIKVFICEEQRHAMVLSDFMKAEGIERIRGHWVDKVFRYLRRYLGLENSVRILSVAEVIAVPYYSALHQATQSQRLRAVCEQILRDEYKHLRFQAETIQALTEGNSKLRNEVANLLQAVLLAVTIAVVWFYHRKVLYAGGYDFFRFLRENVKVFLTLVTNTMREQALVGSKL